MKIGILECDEVKEELRNDFLNYLVMFETLFEDMQNEYEFKVYPVMHGVLPESIDECDAYISTGSRGSVNEKNETVIKLIAFIQELNVRKKNSLVSVLVIKR